MDVKTAGRTVEVFEAFAKAQEPLSLSEIGKILDAPLSSCLYLLRALENRGYLYAVGGKRQIYPTRKLLDIATLIAAGEPWLEHFQPILEHLRDVTKETIILGKRQGTKVVYLAVQEGPQTIRYSASAGDLKPLHASSIGKALLSTLSSVELKKLLIKLPLEAATEHTITDKDELKEDLELSAKRGYVITNAEFVEDVMAIARAVKFSDEYYAIAVAGPLYRMRENKSLHAEILIAACKEIEKSSSHSLSGKVLKTVR